MCKCYDKSFWKNIQVSDSGINYFLQDIFNYIQLHIF